MIYQLLSLLRVWGCDLGRTPKVPWLTPCSHAAPSVVGLSVSPHPLPSYSTIRMNIWLWQLSKNVGQRLCGQLDLSHLVIQSLCSLDSDPSICCGDNLSNASLVFFHSAALVFLPARKCSLVLLGFRDKNGMA